jgi:hypothetical protein
VAARNRGVQERFERSLLADDRGVERVEERAGF